jgi:PAS domain S-box-containing protein
MESDQPRGAAPDGQPEAGGARGRRAPTSPGARHEPLRVLVVEADDMLALVAEVLATKPVSHGCARTVAGAASYLTAYGPADVLIVDRMLPDGDGLEVIDVARRHNPQVEVVVMSGLSSFEAVLDAIRAGSTDYVPKPLELEALDLALERAFDQVTLKREASHTYALLTLSEERYSLALRASNDGLWDWDLATNHIYLSPRWKEMLGLEGEQLGNSPDEWFGRVHCEDLPGLLRAISELIRDDVDAFTIEYRVRHADGGYRWFQVRGVVVRDHVGQALRMAGSQSDITQRKAMEDQLIRDSMFDALTGLPTRSLFGDRLDQAFASDSATPTMASPCCSSTSTGSRTSTTASATSPATRS